MKIVVVGTGYVGLPAALMWARSGIETIGVDIDRNVVEGINAGTLVLGEADLKVLLGDPDVTRNLSGTSEPVEGDVFVIAVPTPVDEHRKVADLGAVKRAVDSICPVLRPGNLVIVESTIPPMTCRDVIAPRVTRQTGLSVPDQVMLAHCPERILPGNVLYELVHNDRLIGGMDEASTEAAADAYSKFVRGALHRTNDLVAELTKLFENTYRDVNIAMANELSLICESLGAEPQDVISLANNHPRVNILDPGIGVGGHCIPIDPWFLKEVAPYDSRLITTARLINDEMPSRIAKKIRRAVAHLQHPTIVALGATYKRNSDDTREAPAKRIVDDLREDGYRVRHLDPLVPELSYLSLSDELSHVDLVAVLVGHDQVVTELNDAIAHRRDADMTAPHVLCFDSSVSNKLEGSR